MRRHGAWEKSFGFMKHWKIEFSANHINKLYVTYTRTGKRMRKLHMEKRERYQNYIFDLYGTLADIHTDEDGEAFWEKICGLYETYGIYYVSGEMKQSYQRLLRMEADQLPYEYPEPDIKKVFQKLALEKGGRLTNQQVLNIAGKFRKFSRKYLRLYDGAAELLEKLKQKGKSIYLLSNAQAAFTESELEILGIRKYFNGIFLSSEHQCKKPDIHFYQKLFAFYQLKPEESIMIGNDLIADIQGGQKAGMDTFYFHSNLSPELTEAVNSTFQILDGNFRNIVKIL